MAEMVTLADMVNSFGDLDVARRIDYHKLLQNKIIDGDQKAVEHMITLGLEWQQELTPVKHNPMHIALQKGNAEWVKLLLQIENLACEPNCFGETPLHLACRRNMKDMTKLLLKKGVDMDARDKEGGTPLYHAVYKHSIECIQLLIKEGCDLDALNSELLTSLDQALLNNHQDTVALLLRAGCTTKKLKGHVFYKDHMANSFFCALWENRDLENMCLFLDCGYCLNLTEVSVLKSVCHLQVIHEKERETLKILRDMTERPQKLMILCRISIRRILMNTRCLYHSPMETMIGYLPMPDLMKQFLMMNKN